MAGLALIDDDRARYEEVSAEVLRRGVGRMDQVEGAREKARYDGRPVKWPPALTADDLWFAERIFEAFDAWAVVTEEGAAEAAGVTIGKARISMLKLKANRSWPYRSAKWRHELAEGEPVGPLPFSRPEGERATA